MQIAAVGVSRRVMLTNPRESGISCHAIHSTTKEEMMLRSMRNPRALFAFTVCALCVFLASCQMEEQGMSEQDIQTMVESSLISWNTGDFSKLEELYTADYVRHSPGILEDIVGLDAFEEYIVSVRTTYPDFNVATENVTATEDGVVLFWTVTGTQDGPSDNLPQTGAKVTLPGVSITRVVDGKIAEEWVYWNHASMLSQLGFTFIPPAMETEE